MTQFESSESSAAVSKSENETHVDVHVLDEQSDFELDMERYWTRDLGTNRRRCDPDQRTIHNVRFTGLDRSAQQTAHGTRRPNRRVGISYR